ncbi:MAG: hypothetical protein MR411_03425 [Tenericutes bacterium]|nr:hypothetical protein [Mycoplasmatota bacterium]
MEEDLVYKALVGIHIPITNYNEAFYVMAAFNLLNKVVKEKDKYNISYDFKKYIGDKIVEILNIENINVFLDKDVCYIKFLDYQFSFHNISYGEKLLEYKNSKKNIHQEWSQIRLQEKAFEIFEEAIRRMENE